MISLIATAYHEPSFFVAAIVVFIDLRDRLTYNQQINNGSIQAATTEHTSTTRNEAQLAAMLENAKKSSWQDNLRNAADAQDRFMLPGRDVDSGRRDAPEYIKRIDERSEEILQTQEEEKNKANEKDPSNTRFWK